ncbi:MAG: phosphate propanoyltransferase [Vagococcus sp.]
MKRKIPIGISNRHIHLSYDDFKQLFPNEEVKIKSELRQPGFYACEQTVTIAGPKGELERVRLLGPLRNQTQVELSLTDARKIGVKVPIRMSGILEDSTVVTISSDHGSIERQSAIAAKRHIHMNPADAAELSVKDLDVVDVLIDTDGRSTLYHDVDIRVSDKTILEMHIDTDEANAANVSPNDTAIII